VKKDPTNVSSSVVIEKPVQDVWRVLTDMNNMPFWARGVEKILSIDPPGEIALGTRVTDIGLGLKRRWPETFWVDVFTPYETIGFKWMGSYGTAYVRYRLEDLSGKTRLHGETYGDYRFPFSLILQFMGKTASDNFRAGLENIKRLCHGERGFKK
jgi:hypothetical protein